MIFLKSESFVASAPGPWISCFSTVTEAPESLDRLGDAIDAAIEDTC